MSVGGDPVPSSLAEAFRRYEQALMDDDTRVLDDVFAPAASTMRADERGLLVGHDTIASFRATRPRLGDRVIESVQARVLSETAVLLVSVSRYSAGGRGVQSQLWERVDGQWHITSAHVSGTARALDRSVWRVVGDPLVAPDGPGPLRGLSVAVKDLFDVRGFAVGAGVPAWLEESVPAEAHAPALANLLGAGAHVVGIARTDEFAYSIAGVNRHYGTPANAAVPGAIPGGSSSGSATAVATGSADVGLGTDTAGSIRVPASYQGLWGLRTTHDRLSRDGVLPLAPSFDTIGWLTRDGATMAAVVDALIPSATETSTPASTGRARSVLHDPATLVGLAPDVRDGFLEVLDAAAGDGFRVEAVTLPPLGELLTTFRTIQQAEAWRAHGPWLRSHPGVLGAETAERFRAASLVSPEDEAAARTALASFRERIRSTIGDDVLIVPTAPAAAPSLAATPEEMEAVRVATLRLTSVAGIAGVPALSVPLLRTSSGPVGISVLSAAGSESTLVEAARSIAAAAPASPTSPIIPTREDT